jgi:glycosyltransferase involved in cell wall biosynthesis
MRITYCANVRLPNERAHGHQVARVCDALAKLGHDVTIFAPLRRNPIREDFHAFHGADRQVRIAYLGTFDPIDRAWLPKAVQLPLLNAQLRSGLRRELSPGRFDLAYTRTPALLGTLLDSGTPTVLELHTVPRHGREAFAAQCNRCALVACLTSPMREEVVALGVDEARVAVEPDAADLEAFVAAQPRPADHALPIVGYAGQLESMGLSKGIPELLDALTLLNRTEKRCRGMIAGPEPKDPQLLSRLKQHPHVTYLGFLPSYDVPALLAACDVLAYPAPASDHPFYVRDTSPLKIFEYMAAGKPIVTADLPPIRDVLDESTAFFCRPGDPADLARAIDEALEHPADARVRAQRARARVRDTYTWGKRMERILARIQGTKGMQGAQGRR